MTDYISREAAIEAIGEMPLNWTDSPEELQEVADWEEHLHAIMAVPAADVRPVVRGRWERWDERTMVCSNCKRNWIRRGTQCEHNFCLQCGADMRRENGTNV